MINSTVGKSTDTDALNEVNNRKQLNHVTNVTNLVKTNYAVKRLPKHHCHETANKVFHVRFISLITASGY